MKNMTKTIFTLTEHGRGLPAGLDPKVEETTRVIKVSDVSMARIRWADERKNEAQRIVALVVETGSDSRWNSRAMQFLEQTTVDGYRGVRILRHRNGARLPEPDPKMITVASDDQQLVALLSGALHY